MQQSFSVPFKTAEDRDRGWIKRLAAGEMTETETIAHQNKTYSSLSWGKGWKIAEAPKCTFWWWKSRQGSLKPTHQGIFHAIFQTIRTWGNNTCSIQSPWPDAQTKTGILSVCVLSFQLQVSTILPSLLPSSLPSFNQSELSIQDNKYPFCMATCHITVSLLTSDSFATVLSSTALEHVPVFLLSHHSYPLKHKGGFKRSTTEV